MEVKKKFHHPDQERVKNLITEVLAESRRRVAEWHVEMLDFEFYSSSYQVKLMLDEHVAIAAIPTEWIDEVWEADDKFKRKRIKRQLKKAVENFYDLEDE